jgi:protease-4
VELRDGDKDKNTNGKPLVVSMGSMAASGGYYAAVPANTIFAERTTMTGSIGVYASFPDLRELGKKCGFGMRTIKQGLIKDSGSPFKEMTPEELQVWQDMVDHAYRQFMLVVEQGRPKLKGKLMDPIQLTPVKAGPVEAGPGKPYQRYLADGGIWTSDKAKELGLIDQIGYLDDAIQAAKGLAGLTDYKAVKYEKPPLLTELILGTKTPAAPGALFDPGRLQSAVTPRLWYLAPGCDLAGVLAAVEAP